MHEASYANCRRPARLYGACGDDSGLRAQLSFWSDIFGEAFFGEAFFGGKGFTHAPGCADSFIRLYSGFISKF